MAEKKKDKDKGKDKQADKGKNKPYGEAPPTYNPNASQRLSPYAQNVGRQLTELLKRSDPSKNWSKDSMLFNLTPQEQQQVLGQLSPEQRGKYRKLRDQYSKQGLDQTYQAQPGTGPGGETQGLIDSFTQGLGDRLAPFIRGQTDQYIRQAQDANLTSRDTPEGTVNYERDPVTGQIKETTKLSPEQQRLYDAEVRGSTAGKEKGAGILEGYKFADQPAFDRQSYEDAEYEALTRDVTKRQALEDQQFTQMMADKGIAPGSEQYNREYELLQGAHGREMIDARDSARRSGGTEATENLKRWGYANQMPVETAGALYGIGAGHVSPNAYAPPNVNVPFTNLGEAAINLAGRERELDQNDIQFINNYGLDAWKAKKSYDLSNKQPSGGGGGGGGAGGYSFSDIMGMIPEQGGAPGGYQPTPGEQAVETGVNAFQNAATSNIAGDSGAKMYTQQTPKTQYTGQFGKKGGLFGGGKGMFG